MMVYINDPKNSTRELLQLKTTSAMWLDIKLTQINQYPFFIQMTNSLRKKLGKQLFTRATNNSKYVGINQTKNKKKKDLYPNNFKSLKKVIKNQRRTQKMEQSPTFMDCQN